MSAIGIHLPASFADLIIATKGEPQFLAGKRIKLHGTEVKIISAQRCADRDGLDMYVEVPRHLMSLFQLELNYLSFDKDN